MTAPSTTILVNGTTDGTSIFDAASVDGEQELPERNSTGGAFWPHLVVPHATASPRRPSAHSFNSSVDRLEREDHQHENPQPAHVQQQDHDGDNIQHTPLNSVALTDGIHHPLHHINSVTDHHDHLALGAPFRNSATYEPNPQITTSIAPHNPVTLAPAPSTSIPSSMAPSPSPHPSAADTFSDLRTTTPLPSVPTFTSSDPPATQGHVRHPRRHRLPRWLRRRLDHPVPWRIGLRRRAENIRQILGRVERLMQ